MGLSIAVRRELLADEEKDIHVCTVLPSAMDTPFWDHAGNFTGHEATPIPPLYDPQRVIDAILELAVDPQDEVQVGVVGSPRREIREMLQPVGTRITGRRRHSDRKKKS